MKKERICAFYSRGPHFVRMLRCLRENYPHAVLVAAIPSSFPLDVIAGLTDETIRLPNGDETPRSRRDWATLRRIRKARCTQIVVMFDSPRLALLSLLSGAPKRRCFTVDGRFYRIHMNPVTLCWIHLGQRVRGQWHYLRAWWGTRKV